MTTPLKTQRIEWLAKTAAGYTGAGFNPEAKMAARGPHRRPLAMAARCYQCAGSADPNVTRRIAECPIVVCSLHPHRSPQDGGYRENLAALKARLPPAPPGAVLSPMERARLNPESRALAVRAYCYDCMGGQPVGDVNTNGNLRKMVGDCSVTSCALWDVRPWQKTADEQDNEESEESDDADECADTV